MPVVSASMPSLSTRWPAGHAAPLTPSRTRTTAKRPYLGTIYILRKHFKGGRGGSKMPKLSKSVQKRVVKMSKRCQKIVQNWPKLAKIGQTWPKLDQMFQNCPKVFKKVQKICLHNIWMAILSINSLLDKADRVYRQLIGNKPILESLLLKVIYLGVLTTVWVRGTRVFDSLGKQVLK